MNLADIAPKSSCRIVNAAADHPDLQSRLYALGLYPGAAVDVLRYAPAGDPMQIRIGMTLLSIRKQEALLITVELIAVEAV
ncbi:MAG: ferrous iron transport protein A [Candidatus Azotimanducaceae bacterium]|jgi:ferrous iron transport protein A